MKLETILKGQWIKDPQPVLDIGQKGEWDDLMVDCPCVFSHQSGEYSLFYTGHNSRNHGWGIGCAKSKDLSHWIKEGGNPILQLKKADGWGSQIDGASVLCAEGKFYLFFEAMADRPVFATRRLVDILPCFLRRWGGSCKRSIERLVGDVPSQAVRHASGRAIGFMVSDDMKCWSSAGANPVFRISEAGDWDSAGVFSPCVLSIEGRYYLYYGGSDGRMIRTGLAESRDLYSWKRHQDPVLVTGHDGSWDDSSVIIVSILKLEDAYAAFYEGQDRHNQHAVGLAFSSDGIRWKKYERNPILTKGAPGMPDERLVNSPHGFQEGDHVFCFYGASNHQMEGRCMRARFSAQKR